MKPARFRRSACPNCRDGNVADALAWKIEVRVLAGHDIVSAQIGQVFCNDAVDFALLFFSPPRTWMGE